MRFEIITVFPDQISQFIEFGIFRIAKEVNVAQFNVHDLRSWTNDIHKSVDDRPYGGGAGMVLKVEPIAKAISSIQTENSKVIAFTAQGETMNQKMFRNYSDSEELDQLILLCGHYEGFDQRILENFVDQEISLGDFVLSGGEIPALTFMDGITRLLPGVLGNNESHRDESFENSSLEYPHYTRPDSFNNWDVPKVLLSGNHKEIQKWREQKSKEITESRRPDLLD
jgi:tRNA (guanine37-N1)-methyltransferase